MKFSILLLACLAFSFSSLQAENKHSPSSRYPSYNGLVMAGYQGWFRAPEDGSGRGWGHYAVDGKFDPTHVHIDIWPDVSEYQKTYATELTGPDGKPARVFSSWDESTTDLHFQWMEEYGVDGVFMQRFFGYTRTKEIRARTRVILGNALKASQKHGRAIAVMYDLSGLADSGEDLSTIMEDWKELVDEMKITSQGKNQTYLYHRSKPLVALWGIGFPDRKYNIHNIGLEKLIDFFKNDPVYGGCSIMLGVPNYFRDLEIDTLPDPYLHELIAKADIVMPWTVQRFTPLIQSEKARYEAQVKKDLAWCKERKIDYAPCVYPGFSWFHLSKVEFGGGYPMDQIPRRKGQFYWDQMNVAIGAGAKMLYVAMFDEMDEATAIFKCTNTPPGQPEFLTYEGLPSDHYLWLTGRGRALLRGEILPSKEIPERKGNGGGQTTKH